MPDVHGRTNARDIKAAGNCVHAHVRVVTASGVHFSRAQTIDVLEQVLLGEGRSTASIVRLLPTRVADAGLAS